VKDVKALAVLETNIDQGQVERVLRQLLKSGFAAIGQVDLQAGAGQPFTHRFKQMSIVVHEQQSWL
jgi:hypothetical protein